MRNRIRLMMEKESLFVTNKDLIFINLRPNVNSNSNARI